MTVPNKKLARYVRGPDGIFRRLSEDPAPTVPSIATELVEDIVNELIDCGQILPDPVHLLPNPATHQHDQAFPVKTPAALLAPNSLPVLPLTAMPFENGSRDSFDAASKSDSSDFETASTIESHVAPHLQNIVSMLRHFRRSLYSVPLDRYVQWIFPFLLGMATMYVLQMMEPTLRYCGVVLAHYLKLALIYGVIAFAALWYSGTVSFDSWSAADFDFFKARVVDLSHSAKINKVNAAPVLLHQESEWSEPRKSSPTRLRSPVRRAARLKVPVDPNFSSEKPSTTTTIHPEECEVTSFTPFQHIPSARPIPQRLSTDIREKPRLKSKMLPVFIGKDRRHSSASLPRSTDASRGYKEDYNEGRFKDDSYRDVRDPFRNGQEYRDKSRDARTQKFLKPLPPVIKMPANDIHGDSDLPLAYEVKLKNLDQDSRYGLDRLGTVMSTKSVLGTRANYLKFLSNVEN